MNDDLADQYVHALVKDWRAAPLAPVDRALGEYAAKLTHTPGQMSPTDHAPLRAYGLDDRAISDATQIVGYFNYINRVADGLGIEPEESSRVWGNSST
jgi:uncharacterized peroxidase-related enzyme